MCVILKKNAPKTIYAEICFKLVSAIQLQPLVRHTCNTLIKVAKSIPTDELQFIISMYLPCWNWGPCTRRYWEAGCHQLCRTGWKILPPSPGSGWLQLLPWHHLNIKTTIRTLAGGLLSAVQERVEDSPSFTRLWLAAAPTVASSKHQHHD